jgi:hypothetical protein
MAVSDGLRRAIKGERMTSYIKPNGQAKGAVEVEDAGAVPSYVWTA